MKVPFVLLVIEVNKLYSKQFSSDQDVELDEHIVLIEEYIQACGWSVQEYIERYISESIDDDVFCS
jgi:hypothetical protein